MSDNFENKWAKTFREERKVILLWERPFLPEAPAELTEDSVLAYLKTVGPAIRRGKILPLFALNWLLRWGIKLVGLALYVVLFLGCMPAMVLVGLVEEGRQGFQWRYILTLFILMLITLFAGFDISDVEVQTMIAVPLGATLCIFHSFVTRIPDNILTFYSKSADTILYSVFDL